MKVDGRKHSHAKLEEIRFATVKADIGTGWGALLQNSDQGQT
jgi:hypothetical protein